MPLALFPATIDDIPAMTKLHFESFLPTCMIDRLLYPYGATSTVLNSTIVSRMKSFGQTHIHYIKVADSENHLEEDAKSSSNYEAHLIGYARWYIWSEDQPMENWDFPYIGSGESGICRDVNVDLENKFLRLLKEQKRKHIGGRNHVYLSLLATSPAYQGRGCGTMLLQWGLQEATRRGFRDVSFFDMKIEAETNKNNDEMTNYRTILMKKVCT